MKLSSRIRDILKMSMSRLEPHVRRYALTDAPIPGSIPVLNRIASKDGMFKKGMEDHYFSVGRSALEAIRIAMLAGGKSDFTSILDLPCGHGRVLRALKAAFPRAKLAACDLNRAGVDFCVQQFGAEGDYSNADPTKIELPPGYDLIWSGSLLTHLDKVPYIEFLRLFANLLAPGGLLVATTHGRRVVERLRGGIGDYRLSVESIPPLISGFEKDGFAYADYPGASGYGVSVNTPEWLMREVVKIPGLRIVFYGEKFWDRHQDVIACVKE